MVDLRVGQKHACDRRRADTVGPLRFERLELLARVRRGVYEKPRPFVATNRQRRLRPGARALTGTRGLARLAMAVPLRKPPARGRAQNSNSHVCTTGTQPLGPRPLWALDYRLYR